jgi:hypothetical protein
MITLERQQDGTYKIIENGVVVSNKILNKVKGYGTIKNSFIQFKGNKYADTLHTKDAKNIISILNNL